MFTEISLFFIIHGYNIPLLNYNISITPGIRNRGVRTYIEIRNEILKKLREISDFTQAIITYVLNIQ